MDYKININLIYSMLLFFKNIGTIIGTTVEINDSG